MPIPFHTQEFTPGRKFREGDPSTLYWIRDNEVIYRHYPVKGAHAESFRFYAGSFGKDRRNCYCTSHKFSGGNGPTFRALNYTYATDGQSVWTMGGKIKDADADSFVVCDDGVYDLGNGIQVPHGFGKDTNRVYFYDYNGKPNWVRKASAASFVSLNDGHFGKDDEFVFCGASCLPKTKVEHWRKIGGYYSRDNARVYYFNRLLSVADVETFEFVNAGFRQLARDKKQCYENGRVVSSVDFEGLLEKHSRENDA